MKANWIKCILLHAILIIKKIYINSHFLWLEGLNITLTKLQSNRLLRSFCVCVCVERILLIRWLLSVSVGGWRWLNYFLNLLFYGWTSWGYSEAVLPVLLAVCVRVCPGWGSVGAAGILWPLKLHFQTLHADLEAVHGLDGSLGTARVIEAHKACGAPNTNIKGGITDNKNNFVIKFLNRCCSTTRYKPFNYYLYF